MTRIAIGNDYMLTTPVLRDAQELFSLVDCNRVHLSSFLPWVKHTVSVLDSEAFIRDAMRDARNGATLHFLIRDAGGVIIGAIGFNKIVDGFGEIGYWIAESHQGRGIMSRAISALESYGFNVLGLSKIQICADENNHTSRHLAEKFNYQLDEVLYVYSKRV